MKINGLVMTDDDFCQMVETEFWSFPDEPLEVDLDFDAYTCICVDDCAQGEGHKPGLHWRFKYVVMGGWMEVMLIRQYIMEHGESFEIFNEVFGESHTHFVIFSNFCTHNWKHRYYETLFESTWAVLRPDGRLMRLLGPNFTLHMLRERDEEQRVLHRESANEPWVEVKE